VLRSRSIVPAVRLMPASRAAGADARILARARWIDRLLSTAGPAARRTQLCRVTLSIQSSR